MNKKAEMMTGVILIIAIVLTALYLVSHKETIKKEEGTITDILQISSGGLGHSDKCILEVDGNKMNFEGGICTAQIGDMVCLKEDEIWWILSSEHYEVC